MRPRKMSTSKGLKQKKTTPWYKGKDQEGKNKHFKETCYICNKERHKAKECRGRLKKNKNKKDQPQADMTDHASPSLSAVVSKVNLKTNNKN